MRRAPFHALTLRLASLLIGLASASGAGAQGPAPRFGPEHAVTHARTDTGSRSTRPVEVAPAIVTSAMPATFVVVSVPVPGVFAGVRRIAFEIIDAGFGTIVGRRAGQADEGVLLVTVGVPRDARAGRRVVAHVRFSADEHIPVEVPIELDVGIVRKLSLTLSRPRHGAAAGARLLIPYHVTNDGNAPDTVMVGLALPPGWRRADAVHPIVVAPQATSTGSARVVVPLAQAVATMRIPVIATSAEVERARTTVLVAIADARHSGLRAGPRLATRVATVWNGDGSSSTVAAAEISGPLGDSLRIYGRLVSDFAPEPSALRGLARVGFAGTPWFLSLDAPSWRADLGVVRVGFTALTGEAAAGTGATVSTTSGPWTGAVIGAGAVTGIRDGSAEYVGLRLARLFDSVHVGATVTHLEERSSFGRSLDAFGVDARAPLAFGASTASELALRRYEGGTSLGWATELSQRTNALGQFQLRLASAPGGSAAFARGTREVTASASRQLSRRMALGGAYWRSRDESAAAQRIGLSGWSLAPRLILSDRGTLSLETGGNELDTRTPTTGFGSAERHIGLVLEGRFLSFHGSTRIQHGTIDRTVELLSGSSFRTASARTAWHGSVGSLGRWGAADLFARIEQSGMASGYEPRRNEAQLRLQGPTLPVGHVDLDVRGDVHHYGWFGDRPSIVALRLAADLHLPWSARLTLDTERNPLFAGFDGGSPWSTAVRLTRSTTIPRLFADHAMRGVVYQDLDADGAHDSGEPGFASAVVRYGAMHGATDDRGRFAFDTRYAGAPRLDVRSIPLGWIVTGTVVDPGGAHVAIGVAPTSSARIRLQLDTAMSERSLRISLSSARVVVRNAGGREWTAPVDATGDAFFDALPAGRYQIEVDLSRLPEPLTIAGGERSFDVGTERIAIERPLLLRPRPVRLRRMTEANAGPGSGATAPAGDSTTAATRPQSTPRREPYVVRQHETLRALAERFLLDEMRWPILYMLNRERIRHPDLILTGQQLYVIRLVSPIPGTAAAVTPP